MNAEERVARAVRERTDALPVPVVDVAEVRRLGRRQQRRRTTAVLAAAALLVTGTGWALASQPGADRSTDPAGPDPDPNPTSTRPLTWAEGGTLHHGDQVVDTGLDPYALTVADGGVALATGDGRVWFTDGGRPEQVGTTDLDVLAAWELVPEGLWGRTVVAAGATGTEVAWFEFPSSGGTEIVVYDSHTHEVVDRVAVDVAPDCTGPCARILGVDEGVLYWTDAPCASESPASLECEDTVPPAETYDLATGERGSLTAARYAAELDGRSRTLGPRDAALDRTDGTPVAGGHTSLFLMTVDGQVQATGVDGLGQVLVHTASGTPLRFTPPAGVREGTGFRFVQWLDDDGFAAVEAGATGPEGRLLVCRLSTGACETAATPSTADGLTLPNF